MSFIKNTLASVLGFFIAMFLFFLLIIAFVASSSRESEPFVRNGSVLQIPVKGVIAERKSSDPFLEAFDRSATDRITMDVFRSNIRKAKNDKRLAGIRLDISNVGGSWVHLVEIRDLLLDFKDSGKFIYAYIDDMGSNEAAFFIATAADSIFAQPETYFEMTGFYIERMFLKDAFEKYGVKADVITTGKYKTAADDYRYNSFSVGDREQLSEILNSFARHFVTAVSDYTGYEPDEINAIMNSAPNISVSNALERGFIDGLLYPHQFEDFVKERAGESRLNQISFGRYARVSASSAGLPRERGKEIAVIYATGPIMPELPTDIFTSGTPMITFNGLKQSFDTVLDDNNVAAIVLRVNSPGGAVTTSEIIREMIETASRKKPVIISMGPVAASGGYYISMGADTIVAQPTTVTGSIGVVLAKLSFEELFEEKLGLKFDQVKTHRHADWLSPDKSFTPEQRRAFEALADETYESFLQLVADARNMEKTDVHRIAQGRVWTGEAALDLGLVDVLGTLEDAIRIAAEMTELEEYKVGYYPTPKTFFESLMEGGSVRVQSLWQSIIGVPDPLDALIRDIRVLNRPQVYSVTPHDFSVN